MRDNLLLISTYRESLVVSSDETDPVGHSSAGILAHSSLCKHSKSFKFLGCQAETQKTFY